MFPNRLRLDKTVNIHEQCPLSLIPVKMFSFLVEMSITIVVGQNRNTDTYRDKNVQKMAASKHCHFIIISSMISLFCFTQKYFYLISTI